MYVKILDGAVDQYPYSTLSLRRDNPNVSFPKTFPEEYINQYGVYSVYEVDKPDYNEETQNCELNSEPTLVDGNWTLEYTVTDKTAEELQTIADDFEANQRTRRDGLLLSSDWTQVADAPVDAATWATYRQALRDLTTHADWPNLDEDDWPTEPS